MAYGRRDGFSFADGVPLKINDRLQPPASIIFPSFTVAAPNLLENEYDFSVEQQALQQFEQHRQAKEAQEKAKADKVAQEIELFAQVPLDTGQQMSKQDTGQQTSKSDLGTVNRLPVSPPNRTGDLQIDRVATLPAWPSATLLNPQPLVKDSSTVVKNVPTKQFNLADFESQSSSPFDMMELQTLNDLEELNTVFQGMAVTTTEKEDQSRILYQETFPKMAGQPINGYQYLPDMKHYHRYSIPDKPQGYYNGYSVYGSPLASGYCSSTVIKDGEDVIFPRLKSSKSTPDIRDEVLQQTNWSRSQTPPPYAQSFNQVPVSRESALELPGCQLPSRSNRSTSLSLPKENVQIPPAKTNSPAVTQTEQPTVTECLPNPYHELEENQQQFSATVAQMGFKLDRVARTVKHLGMDDKKVVDHLCHVQRLEESGYDGNDAETALHLYDYNFNEAKTFLDLLKQFQDLGFQKNAVRKALIRHKNDRDRALDSLLLS